MKKLILLTGIIISFQAKSQDTIFKKDNTSILCKVTKVTSTTIFYTETKIGKSIPLSDVSRYSNNASVSASLPQTTTTQNSTSAPTDCDISKKVDKFDGSITYRADFAAWAKFIKVVKGNDTVYFASFATEGTTANYSKKGVILLLSDGSKIEKPNAEVDCKFRAGMMYDYTTFFRLTKEDLKTLSTKRITDWQLYITERGLGEKRGEKLRESLICLIKS